MPTIECGISNQPDLLVARGPTLPVIIGIDDDLVIGASSLTDIAQQLSPALVDTGSDTTCVDSDLAHALNLPIVNQEVVSGVHGRGMVNFHLARISIPALGATFAGVFAGVHLEAGRQPYSAIMGRDFLRHFRLIYDGRTGAVSLSDEIDSGP